MYVLTNSDYLPVYCSKDKRILYNKAVDILSKIQHLNLSDYTLEETGNICYWDISEYINYDEIVSHWNLTFWKITKVEEI